MPNAASGYTMHHDPLEVKATNLTSVKVERPANLLNLLKYLVISGRNESGLIASVAGGPNTQWCCAAGGAAGLCSDGQDPGRRRILQIIDGDFLGFSWGYSGIDIVGSCGIYIYNINIIIYIYILYMI